MKAFPWFSARIRPAVLCASAVAVAMAPTLAQEPLIRVDVKLVNVVATVKDTAGKPVGALSAEDFQIYDNGVRQTLSTFERRTEQPLSVVLMMDTSGSTAKDLKYETDSANRFLKALLAEGNPADAVELYSFAADIIRQQQFTRNLRLLESAFKRFRPEGATALYDAIKYGAQALEPREGRKVLIVISDGSNTMPNSIDSHQALRAAQLADAVIYPIVVVPITNDAGRSIGGENVLTFMAEGTGGRTFMPSVGAELDKVFSAIIDDLRTQYLLGFYPRDVPPSKDGFHKLEVRVNRPDLRVSARNGYYGEVEGGAAGADARVNIVPETVKSAPPPPKNKKR